MNSRRSHTRKQYRQFLQSSRLLRVCGGGCAAMRDDCAIMQRWCENQLKLIKCFGKKKKFKGMQEKDVSLDYHYTNYTNISLSWQKYMSLNRSTSSDLTVLSSFSPLNKVRGRHRETLELCISHSVGCPGRPVGEEQKSKHEAASMSFCLLCLQYFSQGRRGTNF